MDSEKNVRRFIRNFFWEMNVQVGPFSIPLVWILLWTVALWISLNIFNILTKEYGYPHKKALIIAWITLLVLWAITYRITISFKNEKR